MPIEEATMKHLILNLLLASSFLTQYTSLETTSQLDKETNNQQDKETNNQQDKETASQKDKESPALHQLEDMLKKLGAYRTPIGPLVSDQCRNDGQVYLDGLGKGKEWALRMFDAMPKLPPSGILEGNIIHFPGAYSSCMAAAAENFRGKHCLMGVVGGLENPGSQNLLLIQSGLMRLGHCIPSSCSAEDAKNGFNYFLNNNTKLLDNLTVVSSTLNCHTSDEQVAMNPSDWVMVSVLIAFRTEFTGR